MKKQTKETPMKDLNPPVRKATNEPFIDRFRKAAAKVLKNRR